MRITVEEYAKINWSLDILGSRPDGYHELDMLMQRIALSDTLHFENAKWTSLKINGRPLPMDNRNLVVRAASALNEYMGRRRGARILLDKRIPVRAGLGGGSADCAATLLALNRLWNLRLPMDTLLSIGKTLGADVPFCLAGGFRRVCGIGEQLGPAGAAQVYPLVLAFPGGTGLSTANVFRAYDAQPRAAESIDTPALARAVSGRDFSRMRALSGNALEAPAIALMPGIAEKIDALYNLGARVVRMTGSGSCVYGVFRTTAEALAACERLPVARFSWTLAE